MIHASKTTLNQLAKRKSLKSYNSKKNFMESHKLKKNVKPTINANISFVLLIFRHFGYDFY